MCLRPGGRLCYSMQPSGFTQAPNHAEAKILQKQSEGGPVRITFLQLCLILMASRALHCAVRGSEAVRLCCRLGGEEGELEMNWK